MRHLGGIQKTERIYGYVLLNKFELNLFNLESSTNATHKISENLL